MDCHFWDRLSRRGFLIGGTAAVAGTFSESLFGRSGACVLAAEQEEGPYYVGRELIRKNVAEDRKGVPLKLQVKVVNSSDCSPLRNAAVDIWHCDAGGEYSGFAGNGPGGPPPFGMHPPGPPPSGPPPNGSSFGPPPDGEARGREEGGFHGPPPHMGPTNKKTFLRGVQLTDETGCAEFLTIYPGWYMGRCIHIHVKVHVGGQELAHAYTGGHVSHTGQVFFPEDLSQSIAGLDPYVKHSIPRTLHAEDHVFQDQHGQSAIADVQRVQEESVRHGLVAIAMLGVDPKATPAGVGFGGSPMRG